MATVTLYHGTSSELLSDIDKKGLSEPCLSDDFEVAEYFAEEASEDDGGEPIVLSVEVTDTSLLRADTAMIEEPVLRGERRERYKQSNLGMEEAVWAAAEDACKRTGVKGWADLPFDAALEIAGSVCYGGTIPGAAICEA